MATEQVRFSKGGSVEEGDTVTCGCCGELSQAVLRPAGFDKSEFWGHVETRPVYALVCGNCGHENIEKAYLCVICHTAPATLDDYCGGCWAEIDAEEAREAAEALLADQAA